MSMKAEVGCLRRANAVAWTVLLASLAFQLPGQQERWQWTLAINDPRPLASVAEALEHHTGLQINYEDPAYMHPADLPDVTALVERTPGSAKRRVHGPRYGRLDLQYELEGNAGASQVADVLERALSHHRTNGNAGDFKVLQDGLAIHIVPFRVRGPAGEWVEQKPILDTPITLPERERSGLELVGLVCSEITRASGVTVIEGTMPFNLLAQQTVVSGADNEPARAVLVRAFSALSWREPALNANLGHRKLAWQLFYDADTPQYVLNLHIVMRETPVPFGGTRLMPAQ